MYNNQADIDIKPLVDLIRSNWKYIVLIFITTQLTILFVGLIDFQNPAYQNSDFHKYLQMANTSPSISEDVIRPFVYRIIIPFVVGLLPLDVHHSFLLLNNISLVFLPVILFLFLLDHNISSITSLLFTICFQLNRYIFQFNAWNYFQVSDTCSLAILFLSFLLLKRNNWIVLFLLIPLGVLVKEYVLIFIPAGLFILLDSGADKKNYVRYFVLSILSISIFIIIRKIIISEGGESLFVQYTTQVIYYSKPILLIKRFIIPFTPFGLMPILFYKDLFSFFRKNKHFLVYAITVIIISFFGEPERLMTPLFAVYFLFIADLYQSISIGFKKEYTIYLGILIFIISFIASFYHIWGIVLLPNKEVSEIFTVCTNLAIVVIFYILKISKIRLKLS